MKFEIPKLTRCCFCMPLRRGVITLGYIGIALSAIVIGTCSYFIHKELVASPRLYYMRFALVETVPALVIFCIQLLANILLIFGAHKINLLCLKIFYYYTVSTIGAALICGIVLGVLWDLLLLFAFLMFPVLCCQIYLMILARNLIIKLDRPNIHHFQNQLNEIITGESETGSDVMKNENNGKNRDASHLRQ